MQQVDRVFLVSGHATGTLVRPLPIDLRWRGVAQCVMKKNVREQNEKVSLTTLKL